MTMVRCLNAEGLQRFGAWIQSQRDGSPPDAPFELLEDPTSSTPVTDAIDLPRGRFRTRHELALAVHQSLTPVSRLALAENPGIWAWLSLHLIDSVMPIQGGRRKPNEDARYILSLSRFRLWRHLIWGGVQLVQRYPAAAVRILATNAETHSDFLEQLSGRVQQISNRGFVETASFIYLEQRGGRWAPRRGFSPTKKGSDMRGTIRRLAAVHWQLLRTYDLNSMTVEQIVGLLPSEFGRFIPADLTGSDER